MRMPTTPDEVSNIQYSTKYIISKHNIKVLISFYFIKTTLSLTLTQSNNHKFLYYALEQSFKLTNSLTFKTANDKIGSDLFVLKI